MESRTPPMRVMAWPDMITQRRPNMSDRPPAMEKATAEATDQPPGIQMIFLVSPSCWPICCRIPVGNKSPAEIAGTKDKPMNCC